jgi:hypothetical protein
MGSDLALVGANPSALLWEGDRATAFVSVWQVDWSAEGGGGALVICRDGELRVLCDPPLLGRWLFDTFVAHSPELAHFELPTRPTVEKAAVKIDLDLVAGLSAAAGDVTVHITGVLDRRRTLDSGLRVGGIPWSVSRVYAPCRSSRIEIARSVVPGVPRIADTGRSPVSSSAWLTAAETWARL